MKKICNLVTDATPKWFDLGFQLDIKMMELEVIRAKHDRDINGCFREMLLTWLKMIDPPPSWEGLLEALEHSTVQCGDLAKKIRGRFDMPRKASEASAILPAKSLSVAKTSELILGN